MTFTIKLNVVCAFKTTKRVPNSLRLFAQRCPGSNDDQQLMPGKISRIGDRTNFSAPRSKISKMHQTEGTLKQPFSKLL